MSMSRIIYTEKENLEEVLKHCKNESERKNIIELFKWYKEQRVFKKKGVK